jgi:hypothetical protein
MMTKTLEVGMELIDESLTLAAKGIIEAMEEAAKRQVEEYSEKEVTSSMLETLTYLELDSMESAHNRAVIRRARELVELRLMPKC